MIQIFLNLTSVLIIFFSSLGLIDSKLSEMNESVSLNNIPSLYPGLKWNNPTDTKYPIDYMDGITIEYPDFWFNVRKSNTEPLLRLNLEGVSEEIVKQKVEEIKRIILEM